MENSLRNIYFAGPDATKKTTLVLRLAESLREMGKEATIVSFPSPVSFATLGISSHEQGRTVLGPHALTMAYAFDRLDYAEANLLPLRQEKPDLIFVFDRGPLDGEIYAQARTPPGFEPPEYRQWARNLEQIFWHLFPCDIGFMMNASAESSKKIQDERKLLAITDVFDKDETWQANTRRLFREEKLGPQWHRIGIVDPMRGIEMEFARIWNIVNDFLGRREGRISGERQV